MLTKICEHCKKNPATIHLTDVQSKEVKKEVHLCKECAEAAGFSFDAPLSIKKIFDEKLLPIAGVIAETANAIEKEKREFVCPHCGMTWSKFREGGRLGCYRDYQVFANQMRGLLNDLHCSPGGYVGKTPHPSPCTLKEQQRLEYQRLLKEAIAKEDFQTAAKLRDTILALDSDSAAVK